MDDGLGSEGRTGEGSIYAHGFARVAAATFPCALADPATNVQSILRVAHRCHDAGALLVVYPELCLSGYALDDLFLQDVLLDAVSAAIGTLVEGSKGLRPLLLCGAPLRAGNRLFNCALAVQDGRLLGITPKSHLPNYREFYEKRQFASGAGIVGSTLRVGAMTVPFGTDLLFAAEDVDGFVIHAEICEDLWVPLPPSALAALSGATVLANLSASNITIGKSDTRDILCQSQSARCLAAYVYAAAGTGESTTDLAWDGQVEIFENGAVLAQGDRFPEGDSVVCGDIDLDLLRQERMRMSSFDDTARLHTPRHAPFRSVSFNARPPAGDIGFLRAVERFPFVPSHPDRLARDCYEAYNIQVSGLVQRMRFTGSRRVVLGVSGGLDSLQALLVTVKAFERLGLPREDVLGFSLPGFATGARTRKNASALMTALGIHQREIDIRPTAMRLLKDLDHPYARGEPVYDITFENVQAGLRTDYLFRLANRYGGFVIGTGDLSELALGWCTYGVGDQMAHYNVNSGVPKTLMQHLVRWIVSSKQFEQPVLDVLNDILDSEISPELVPASAEHPSQSTEAQVGPYALQDFNLFYTLRYGFRPAKIAFLAEHAWSNVERGGWPAGLPAHERRAYDRGEIARWMAVFLRRFFGLSQYKRSAMPNGPKVAAGGSLSPRGDWRAPSDASARAWLAALETKPS